jgi:hypothetical protein
MNRIIFALLLTAALPALSAEIRKWVDPDGTVHYSDQPPAGVQDRKLDIKPRPASPAAPAQSLSDKEIEFRKRRMEAENARLKEEKAAADAQARQQSCERAKGQLSMLQAGGRVVRFNARGEREFLSDEDRGREMAAAQRDVDQWCGK